MSRRPEPQSGVVPEPQHAAHFLVLRVRDHARDARAVAAELRAIPALVAALDPADHPASHGHGRHRAGFLGRARADAPAE